MQSQQQGPPNQQQGAGPSSNAGPPIGQTPTLNSLLQSHQTTSSKYQKLSENSTMKFDFGI